MTVTLLLSLLPGAHAEGAPVLVQADGQPIPALSAVQRAVVPNAPNEKKRFMRYGVSDSDNDKLLMYSPLSYQKAGRACDGDEDPVLPKGMIPSNQDIIWCAPDETQAMGTPHLYSAQSMKAHRPIFDLKLETSVPYSSQGALTWLGETLQPLRSVDQVWRTMLFDLGDFSKKPALSIDSNDWSQTHYKVSITQSVDLAIGYFQLLKGSSQQNGWQCWVFSRQIDSTISISLKDYNDPSKLCSLPTDDELALDDGETLTGWLNLYDISPPQATTQWHAVHAKIAFQVSPKKPVDPPAPTPDNKPPSVNIFKSTLFVGILGVIAITIVGVIAIPGIVYTAKRFWPDIRKWRSRKDLWAQSVPELYAQLPEVTRSALSQYRSREKLLTVFRAVKQKRGPSKHLLPIEGRRTQKQYDQLDAIWRTPADQRTDAHWEALARQLLITLMSAEVKVPEVISDLQRRQREARMEDATRERMVSMFARMQQQWEPSVEADPPPLQEDNIEGSTSPRREITTNHFVAQGSTDGEPPDDASPEEGSPAEEPGERWELTRQKSQLEGWEKRLTQQERELEHERNTLADRDSALKQRERTLNDRERTISEREAAFENEKQNQERALRIRERALQKSEAALEERDRELQKWQDKLTYNTQRLKDLDASLKGREQDIQSFEDRRREEQERAEQERRAAEAARRSIFSRPEVLLLTRQLEILREKPDLITTCNEIGQMGTLDGGLLPRQIRTLLQCSEEFLTEARSLNRVPAEYLDEWEKLYTALSSAFSAWQLLIPALNSDFTQPTDAIRQRILDLPGFETNLPLDEQALGFTAWTRLTAIDPDNPPQGRGAGLGENLVQQLIKSQLIPAIRLLQFLQEALPIEVPELQDVVRAWSDEFVEITSGINAALRLIDASWEHTPLYQLSFRKFLKRKHAFKWEAVTFEAILFDLPRPPQADPEIVCRVSYPRLTGRPGYFSPIARIIFFKSDE